MTREDAERKIRVVFTYYFQFAGDREADEVIEALKQKPSYQSVSHNDDYEEKLEWWMKGYRAANKEMNDLKNHIREVIDSHKFREEWNNDDMPPTKAESEG